MLLSSASTSLFLVGWRLPEPNAFNLTSSETLEQYLHKPPARCPSGSYAPFRIFVQHHNTLYSARRRIAHSERRSSSNLYTILYTNLSESPFQ
jgi:hypothetical protein